ncbi:MAG: RNA-binding S4 domain-containing protein [Lentisphaeraceae bacterium]|nr:RNA-binding S4 domain-containing protein [Lentisphaeraceae bacterium]
MQQIEINKEPIELFKFLKFSGLLASGGEAKVAIENSEILVNGEVETQKRKKIFSGDTVTFNGETISAKAL